MKNPFKKFKIVDTSKYDILPNHLPWFSLTEKEWEDAIKIQEKYGDISYEFYYSGIGIGLKIHCLKNSNIIFDITDVSNW